MPQPLGVPESATGTDASAFAGTAEPDGAGFGLGGIAVAEAAAKASRAIDGGGADGAGTSLSADAAGDVEIGTSSLEQASGARQIRRAAMRLGTRSNVGRMSEETTLTGAPGERGDNVFRTMQRSPVEIIARKRDGQTLSAGEIGSLISGLMDGTVADYQMTAFLMATFFRGLDDAETVSLTEAMLHSGKVLNLSDVPGIKVDKHSTGGVGDKVSICLAPLVAACGVPVPMVSGRGLGHTGGTLDKLEAIPGFRTDLDTEAFARITREVGTCMIGQTKDIAPADKRIYALRDVTATVESIPLIVASILSKKLAEGIDALVLDVKTGKGAFMKDEARARELATALVRVGTRAGKRVVAVLTRMDAPLGCEVGNANETQEAIYVLHGKGPADLVECTMVLAEEMLMVGGKAASRAEANTLLKKAIASGDAIRVMEKMVAAQSGDPSVVAHPEKLVLAKTCVEVKSPRNGFVDGIDAHAIGLAGVAMGAGRTRADQKVDPAVGIRIDRKPGDAVQAGDTVARLYVHKASDAEAILPRVEGAFSWSEQKPEARALVVDRL